MQDNFETKMLKARVLLSEQMGLPPLPPDLQMREVVPPLDDCTVHRFCEEMGLALPVMVPVLPVAGAELGWCARNVMRHIDSHGGEIVVGQLYWAVPGIFIETEAHAVWRDLQGRLIDITPKRDGEHEVAFSPTMDLPAGFDFLDRPANVRRRTYRSPLADEKVSRRLRELTAASRRCETERAFRKGMSLDAWIASKIEPDPFERAIDRFIECANRLEAMLLPALDGLKTRSGVTSRDFSIAGAELVEARIKLTLMAEGMVMQGLQEEAENAVAAFG